MKKRARTALGLAVGGTALALAATIATLAREPWKQVVRFPDGRALTLAGATYGEHNLQVGAWWQKLLIPVLPRRLAARSIAYTPNSPYAPDPFIFWITYDQEAYERRWRRASSAALIAQIQHGPYSCVTAVDEHGDTVGPLHLSTLQGGVGYKGILNVPLGAFPRRGQQVRIQFRSPGSAGPLGEFVAANPVPGPHPVWTAEAFPIRKLVAGLACTLTEVVTGLDRNGNSAAQGVPPITRAHFRMTRDGKPDRDWEPLEVTLSDATGNSITPWDGQLSPLGLGSDLRLDGALSTREAAWKLRVELARNAGAKFAPAETWNIRGVRVPGEMEVTSCPGRRRFGKIVAAGVDVLGPDRVYYKHRVRVSLDGALKDHRVTVLARDERGRTFSGYGTTNSGRQQLRGERCEFFLNLPLDSRTLALTVAVQRSRYVEFLAKPTLP